MELIFTIKSIIAIIVLLIGSIFDLRTREVPDLLNYGFFFFALLFNLIISVVLHNPFFFFDSLFAFLFFIFLSLTLFYTGQWGGGDSKLLIGLATLIGLPSGVFLEMIHHLLQHSLNHQLTLDSLIRVLSSNFIINFLINLLFVGAVYSVLFLVFLVINNWSLFKRKFIYFMRKYIVFIRISFYLFLSSIILLVIAHYFMFYIKQPNVYYFMILFFLITFMTLLYMILHTVLKAVEYSCLRRKVSPEKLSVGDWIAEPVYDGKKLIVSPKDLGVSCEQIKKLIRLKKKKKLRFVVVKEGIPFVPSFFLSYILTLFLKTNLLFLLIRFAVRS